MVYSEILQTRLIARFAKILVHSQALQMSHLDVVKNRLAGVEAKLGDIDSTADQAIFIEHNIRPFSAPNDWKFEPCTNYYDTVFASSACADRFLSSLDLSSYIR